MAFWPTEVAFRELMGLSYVLALWPACHNDGARQSAKKMPKALILLPNLEAIILISTLCSLCALTYIFLIKAIELF